MIEIKDKKIILSFDVEFWFDEGYLTKYLDNSFGLEDKYVEAAVLLIMELLEKFKAKATFFVTGKVLESHPDLVKKISLAGNEIGFHGYSHKSLNDLNEQKFREEIKNGVGLIENIIGKKPLGFRAPRFSLNNKTKWALPVLAEYGFEYDSSIFPLKTPTYGVRAPNRSYRISFDDVSKEDLDSPLLEIPITLCDFPLIKFPIGGGVYFRFIPFFFYKMMLQSTFSHRTPIIYLHPNELYKNTPKIEKAPLFKKFIKYYGTKKSMDKLEKLLKNFNFFSAENYLNSK